MTTVKVFLDYYRRRSGSNACTKYIISYDSSKKYSFGAEGQNSRNFHYKRVVAINTLNFSIYKPSYQKT